jgi:hypothetical protein
MQDYAHIPVPKPPRSFRFFVFSLGIYDLSIGMVYIPANALVFNFMEYIWSI